MTCWNYTKQEWTDFQHWKSRQKGWLFFLYRKLWPFRNRKAPEIKIMTDNVWVNDTQKFFQNRHRQFRETTIREAGNIHILEINYEQANRIKEIRIPIPKGKLREAFAVQERLDGRGLAAGK